MSWTLRVVGILVILMGSLSAASNVFPKAAGMAELLQDARKGGISSVHVIYLSPMEAQARWGDGFMRSKEYTYRFDSLPEGRDSAEAFSRVLRGHFRDDGVDLVLDARDPLVGLGGVSLVVPVLYWRFIEVIWLKWMVLAAFVVGVGVMVTRKEGRAPSVGYWLAATCIGSGMLAYFWSEPHSLRRVDGSRGCNFGISGWGVFFRSVCWFGIALLAAFLVVSLRG
ncbi:hypothetical protein [Streptomyces sp. NPDC052042]|uniref:hypothetical protein n=1 Tax=Streptomyces sp. NPDC052042 TaxID=3365683 RepID=UPI0037D0CA26